MDSILSSLGFNVQVFFMQIVLFIVLLVAMNILFWKPFLAHLKGREQHIKDAYHAVENTRHEMEGLRTDYQVRLGQIEAEARGRIQTAIKEAQTERERLIAEARAQSDATLRQGIADMERDKNDALESLRGQMIALAQTAVGKALGPTADPAALRATLEKSLTQNGANPARN